MKCKEFRYDFPDYITNKIDTDLKVKIDQHLSGCESCKNELSSLMKTKAMIDSYSTDIPEDRYFINFVPQVISKIDEKESERFYVPDWVTKFLAPAASLVLILISIPFFFQNHNLNVSNSIVVSNDYTVKSKYSIIFEQPTHNITISEKEQMYAEVQSRIDQKFDETLLSSSDEVISSNENQETIINSMNDEDINKIVTKINSKAIIK